MDVNINNIFFIDTETTPQTNPKEMFVGRHSCVDECTGVEGLFVHRFYNDIMELEKEMISLEGALQRCYTEKAGLHAEFGKIVAISIGKQQATKFYLKSLTGRDEKVLLQQFIDAMEKGDAKILAAHNGFEFDFPFLVRRMIINGLPIPECLNTIGKKPWDVKLEDTMKMWSSTAWNYKVSLELLCHVLGLQSPKKDMTGASVADIYYGQFQVPDGELVFDVEEAAMKKIGEYCSNDVLAMTNAYLRMKGLPILEEDKIERV